MSGRKGRVWSCLIIVTGILVGCVSVDMETLSLFFDGVIPPVEKTAVQGKTGGGDDALVDLKSIHPPFEDRECASCHDTKRMGAFVADVPSLCFECHEQGDFEEAEGETVHSPVEDGECVECHNPHKSNQPHLFQKPTLNTCLGCHDSEDFLGEAEEGEEKETDGAHPAADAETSPPSPLVHKAVLDGKCPVCHAPHKSGEKFLLREALPGPCFQCHKQGDFTESEAAPNVHSPVEDGECAECHAPHRSDLPHLLRAELPGPCFKCHDQEDFTAQAETDTVHSPVEDGECAECHAPHRAGQEFLLRKAVPALCLGCHDLADLHEGADSPEERVRINSEGQTPNGCVQCHTPHRSEEEYLLKEA